MGKFSLFDDKGNRMYQEGKPLVFSSRDSAMEFLFTFDKQTLRPFGPLHVEESLPILGVRA